MIIPITLCALAEELKNIGVHPVSVKIFQNRSEIKPLKIYNVRTPAANILKQELLSCGGDCAVNKDCVTGKTQYSDVLLLGTARTYDDLLRKLKPMKFFGLQQIAAQLKHYLQMVHPVTVLADGRVLSYERMRVMGIINLTNDSFYEKSRRESAKDALMAAAKMLEEGADIIDIGAESTRPGSSPISEEQELLRIIPVVEEIKKKFPGSIVSVDTYRPTVAKTAIECGADIINDITAASDPAMGDLAAQKNVPIILMHMQGTPKNMQQNPQYDDIIEEMLAFFKERSDMLKEKGIGNDKIIIDPGIGFGKNFEHNLTLIKRISEFTAFGLPYLLAASRKTCIGEALGGLSPEERLAGTIALSCQAVVAGAQIVRVHDVKENVQAIRMMEAVR